MEKKDISDISLASYLATRFPTLAAYMDGKRLTFSFKKSDELFKAIDDFYTNHAMVDALTLLDSYRNLKRMLRYREGGESR